MSLLQAVQAAKDAAAHAKPLMKLMDALGALDGELRAAGQLQKDADEAAAKKAALEAEIPSLRSTRDALGKAVNDAKAELAGKQAEFDKGLADKQKQADGELAAKHADVQAQHEQKMTELKKRAADLKDEILELEKHKAEMNDEIQALRQAVSKAHAAVNA